MMILSVIPYADCDQQRDDNHYRVLHHHRYGLTDMTVIVNGHKREVRCTSAILNPRSYDCSIMVHLKPRTHLKGPDFQCKHIGTIKLLRLIQHRNYSITELAECLPMSDFDDSFWNIYPTEKLMKAKLRNLARKGYLFTAYDRLSIGPDDLTVQAKKILSELGLDKGSTNA